MKLRYRKKSTKTGKNFRGGGGRIFLAGQNIFPCVDNHITILTLVSLCLVLGMKELVGMGRAYLDQT